MSNKEILPVPKSWIRLTPPNSRSRQYGIYWNKEDNKRIFYDMCANSNNNVTINFTPDMDTRKGKNSSHDDISFDYEDVFGSVVTPPKSDFTFVQHKYHPSIFNIRLSNHNFTKPELRQKWGKEINTTFTFTGKIGNIDIRGYDESCYFNNLIFNQIPSPEIDERYNKWYSYHRIAINNNNFETLELNNFSDIELELSAHKIKNLKIDKCNELKISRLRSNSLTTLMLPECKSLKIESLSNTTLPNCHTIDFTRVKKIKGFDLDDLTHWFDSLNCEYVQHWFSSSSKSRFNNSVDDFKEELKRYEEHLKYDTKFILSPDTILDTNIFGYKVHDDDSESDKNLFKVGEIFEPNKDGKVIITMKDIVNYVFFETRKNVIEQCNKLEAYLKNEKNFVKTSSPSIKK